MCAREKNKVALSSSAYTGALLQAAMWRNRKDVEQEAKMGRLNIFQSLLQHHRLPKYEVYPYLNVHLRNNDVNDFVSLTHTHTYCCRKQRV